MESPVANGQEALNGLAEAWLIRYNQCLDALLAAEIIDRKAFFDTLWEAGVLERIAPENPEEKHARMELKKAVWEKDREDPELYWRILYSAAAAKRAAQENWSIIAGRHGYVTGAFQGMHKIIFSPRGKELFPDEYRKGRDPTLTIATEFITRAKQELEKRGIASPESLIPIGARGTWNGLQVEIENYTDDGLLWLRGVTPKDNFALFDFTNGKGVPPNHIDPKDFQKK